MNKLSYLCKMQKDTLPTYAIVELLIRLSAFNDKIGNYKDHSIYNDGVMVLTSRGHIDFPRNLVMQQFDEPNYITDNELSAIAITFKPLL